VPVPLKYKITANLVLLRALTKRTDAIAGKLTEQLKAVSDTTPTDQLIRPVERATITPGLVIGALAFIGLLYVIRRRRMLA